LAIRHTDTVVPLTIDEVVATGRCGQRPAAGGNGARIVSARPAVVAVIISCERACGMVTPVVRAQVRWLAAWRC
jgi:hypothetical protein